MKSFDANLLLGRLGWRPIGVEGAGEMLRTMDRFGIEKGLVSHVTACINDPGIGNGSLFAAVAGHEDRLLPVPVVDLNDGGLWQQQLPHWAERGVRALRLVPTWYHNSVTGEGAAQLAEVARQRDWPVVVAVQTVRATPWPSGQPRHALELAQSFPDLRVLMLGADRGHWYDLLAALRSASNLYAELGNLATALSLEQLVAAGLEDRLLAGSGYGASYANTCIEWVRCSGVDAAVREKVLWSNALALLGRG